VTFSPELLLARIAELSDVSGTPGRFIVAFSGGLDSTVLLHALAVTREQHGVPMLAVYVDHGLQRDSTAWGEHCKSFAVAHAIDFASRRVAVDPQSGFGLESAARKARYAVLRNLLEAGDWLLSAHHQDDQAETVLLNLMRGSGPAGLAGISAIRKLAAGWLVRPLLETPRSALEAYANQYSLETISDPSNLNQQFDRNYLRHEVLPRFELRWPDAARRIRRSAELAGEAAALLAELGAVDARQLGERADRLSLAGLRDLGVPRQRNVLRHVILQLGLPLPGAVQLAKIVTDLIEAREDAQPLIAWPGARARRYRDQLYLLPADDLEAPAAGAQAICGDRLLLPAGLGLLVLEHGAKRGLSEALTGAGLELRFRVGGEKFKPYGQAHTKKLKKLLQEEGIVPWMRDRIPLVYAGDELVAVADLWIVDGAASEPGTAIRWRNRPALH